MAWGWEDILSGISSMAKSAMPGLASAAAPFLFQQLFAPRQPQMPSYPQPASPYQSLNLPSPQPSPAAPPVAAPPQAIPEAPPPQPVPTPTAPVPTPTTISGSLPGDRASFFTGGETGGTPISRPEGGENPYRSPGLILPSTGFSSLSPSRYRRSV